MRRRGLPFRRSSFLAAVAAVVVVAGALNACATFSAADAGTGATRSASAPASPVPGAAQPNAAVPSNAAASGAAVDALKTMGELSAASRAAFDSNHPVEAVRLLVALLAVDETEKPETEAARSASRAELARRAETELVELGARLTLEPTDEWLSGGARVAGNVRDLAKGTAPMPAVRLLVNYDSGKAVVADAPIRFTVVDGIGELAPTGTTDAYGTASTVVRKVARLDAPLVVRATLVVSGRGKTRAFPEVSADFTYLPADRTARIIAFERPSSVFATQGAVSQGAAPQGAARFPLVDAVARGLASSPFVLTQMDASSDGPSFQAVLAGDTEAIAAALKIGGRPASYLIVSVAEYDEARKLVYQGKAYEIYTVDARAQTRVHRADGSVFASRPSISVRGQAGSPEAARLAALASAREAVEKDMVVFSEELRAAAD